MRAVGIALLALCLAAGSAVRAPRLTAAAARDHRSPDSQLSDAPATSHATASRRRDLHPDRGRAPGFDLLATVGAPAGFTPPSRTWLDTATHVTTRAARPLPLPRTSRGPPLG
jgi:hypothetical protein